MGIKTRLIRILRVNAKERDSIRKGVKALVYNEITEGEYKGWFKIEQLIPPEGVDVSVWTKEQSEDLDKRFGGVNTRLDSLEEDMKEVKSNIKKILEILGNK